MRQPPRFIHTMIGRRNAYIAARARNAARRSGWIAGIGSVAGVAVLMALVLVPRELDRQLRQRIAALPVAPDSMPLVQRLDSLRGQQRALERLLFASSDTVVTVDSTPRALVRDTAGGQTTPVNRAGASRDSAMIDLAARVTRARSAPLADSYRALAQSPVLQRDPRVRSLIDSIDTVDREREAHAALGGPGARYAALTTHLMVLGQGLVRLAEQRLARATLSPINAAPSSAGIESTSVSPADSSANPVRQFELDSTRQFARDSTRDVLLSGVAQQESVLVTVRLRAAEHAARRAALEQRLSIEIPFFASLVAALAVGVAFGYGVMLWRELRRPTVGEASEIERLTDALVLRHTRETATTVVARRLWRERRGIPRIIDQKSDTFVILHLALTGVGDVVQRVDVLGADPVIAAAVALGTAAAATHESRAVLVVEDSRRTPVLARLLHLASRPAMTAARYGPTPPGASIHVVRLDRDAHIDVRLAGGDGTAPNDAAAQEHQLALRYDLRLHLADGAADAAATAGGGRDVILCVCQGSTPLRWLSRATKEARRRQQRVRGIVLWNRDVPTGS